MTIAGTLREVRIRAGLTQRALAQRAGVPQSTVARIESGAINPRIETVERILGPLGHRLEIDRLYGRDVDRSLLRRMLRLTPTQRVQYSVAGGEAIVLLQEGVRRSQT